MRMKPCRCAVLLVPLVLWSLPAGAGWEVGARVAADSNVTRSVDGATSDTYLYGYVGYSRDASGEKRLDWTFGATLEGAAYDKVTDFNYAAVTLSPGLWYSLRPGWTVTLGPFFQGKTVEDSDESALAWGARFGLEQRIGSESYLGEYYSYTDSSANASVFSYTEHALGAYLGHNWTSSLWTEAGYQFSRGDSFQGLGSSAETTGTAARAGPGGMGMGGPTGRQVHGQELVKETVDSHQLSAVLDYSLTQALTGYIGYTFVTSDSELGTSQSHTGYLGVGYRFH